MDLRDWHRRDAIGETNRVGSGWCGQRDRDSRICRCVRNRFPRGAEPSWPRGWADLTPIDNRDDYIVADELNHQALFRRVAAVVHHGGAGTTTTAAQSGAPQVVVPQTADQPYWAARVAELGIVAAHAGSTPTTASLSSALETALAPQTRVRATAIAEQIRTDRASTAVTLLLDAISS